MREQVIMSAPSRIKVGTYLTPKGARLKAQGVKKKDLAKYTKNRYAPNPESKPVKVVVGIKSNGQLDIRTKTIKHVN